MQSPDAEAELVRRLIAGDEAAFVGLVRAHHRAMHAVARSFVGDPQVAAEVVQETWLAVLSGIDRFEGRSSLRTWLFRILANRARTRAVREGRTVPFSAIDDEPGPSYADRFDHSGHWSPVPKPWTSADPETAAARAQDLAVVAAAIDALPPRQRAVIVLRDVEGLTSEDACNVLDVEETNQRVLLHRARTAVRAALDARYAGKKA